MENAKDRIIGVEDVMQICGVGRATATRYLNRRDCPTLPRVKNSPYRVSEQAFLRWLRKEAVK